LSHFGRISDQIWHTCSEQPQWKLGQGHSSSSGQQQFKVRRGQQNEKYIENLSDINITLYLPVGQYFLICHGLEDICGAGLLDLGPKWVRLAPNSTNLENFSDQISVDFGSPSQNILKSDLKKSRFCPIWGQYDPLFKINVIGLVRPLPRVVLVWLHYLPIRLEFTRINSNMTYDLKK